MRPGVVALLPVSENAAIAPNSRAAPTNTLKKVAAKLGRRPEGPVVRTEA